VTDFLKKTLDEIESRRRELEPLVEEYRQLEEAAAALQGVNGATASRGPARGGRRPASSRTTTRRRGPAPAGGARRRGRPRGSGKRAQQALDLVAKQPGITIPELAKAMKIQPNYLYRVLPGLEKDGKVKKQDKGWFPAS
jgi:predicted Rossmann fold nucleotide-binding protein DprA/Smf involved in DNA uptake